MKKRRKRNEAKIAWRRGSGYIKPLICMWERRLQKITAEDEEAAIRRNGWACLGTRNVRKASLVAERMAEAVQENGRKALVRGNAIPVISEKKKISKRCEETSKYLKIRRKWKRRRKAAVIESYEGENEATGEEEGWRRKSHLWRRKCRSVKHWEMKSWMGISAGDEEGMKKKRRRNSPIELWRPTCTTKKRLPHSTC